MALSITTIIWMTGIHSVLHGIWGIILVQTSHYVNFTPSVNYGLTVVYALFIVLGISVFCVLVSRLPICAVIFGVIFAILGLALLISTILYLVKYWPFYANSTFDAMLFYTDIECWVCNDHAMTIWHFLTVTMLLVTLLWFFYGMLLCKYARCVCCIPCPTRSCYKPQKCPEQPCCPKDNILKKLFKPKCVAPPPTNCCTTYQPAAPTCGGGGNGQVCPSMYSQQTFQPAQSCTRKGPKFVLTLKPGRYCK